MRAGKLTKFETYVDADDHHIINFESWWEGWRQVFLHWHTVTQMPTAGGRSYLYVYSVDDDPAFHTMEAPRDAWSM